LTLVHEKLENTRAIAKTLFYTAPPPPHQTSTNGAGTRVQRGPGETENGILATCVKRSDQTSSSSFLSSFWAPSTRFLAKRRTRGTCPTRDNAHACVGSPVCLGSAPGVLVARRRTTSARGRGCVFTQLFVRRRRPACPTDKQTVTPYDLT